MSFILSRRKTQSGANLGEIKCLAKLVYSTQPSMLFETLYFNGPLADILLTMKVYQHNLQTVMRTS